MSCSRSRMDSSIYENVTLGATTPVRHHDYMFEDPIQRYILAVIVACTSTIGIPGNCLVMAAVAASKKLQTKTNVFVVNLAITDLATCLILPCQSIALACDVWPLPWAVCTFAGGVTLVGLWASVVNLAMIALNRYILICQPRPRYDRIFSRMNLAVMLVFAWIIPSAVIIVPPLFGIGGVGFSVRYKVCTTISTNAHSDLYATSTSGAVQLPCLIIIVTCYVKIYRYIARQGRELLSTSNSKTKFEMSRPRSNTISNTLFRRQVEVTKNLFMVVCSYIMCIMPFAVASMMKTSYPAMPWVSILLIMNSCVNPIIYGVKHPQFRVVFRQMALCKWEHIRNPSRSSRALPPSTGSSSLPLSEGTERRK